jgi:hypothetical protein
MPKGTTMSNGVESGPFRSLRLNNFVARHPDRLPLLQAMTFAHMPAFVDRDWVLRRTDLVLEDLGVGYDHRFMAGHLSLLTDWPEECTMDPVHYAEVAAQALRLLGGARKLGNFHYDLGCGSDDPSAPRRGPFGPWLDGIQRPLPAARSPADVVVALLGAGRHEDARDFALLEGLFLHSKDHRLDGILQACLAGGETLSSVATALVEWRSFAAASAALLERHVPKAVEKAGGDVHSAAAAVLEDFSIVEHPLTDLLLDIEGEHGAPRYIEDHRKDVGKGDLASATIAPEVVLPSFVDASWLSKRLGLSGSVCGRINARRDVVERFSSVGTVHMPPKLDGPSVAAIALEGLRQPFLLTALNLDVLPQDRTGRGRWDVSLFRPFYKELTALLKGEPVKTVGSMEGFDDVDVLTALVAKGHVETAKTFCILRGSELYDEGFDHVLKKRPEFDEVRAFLRSRRRLKAWSDLMGAPGLSEGYRRIMGYGREPSAAKPPPALVIEAHPDGHLGPRLEHRVSLVSIPLISTAEQVGETPSTAAAAPPAIKEDPVAAAAASWSFTMAVAKRFVEDVMDFEPSREATVQLRRLLAEADMHARTWAAAKKQVRRVRPDALALRQSVVDLCGICGSSDLLADLPDDVAGWIEDPGRFVRISGAAGAAVEEAVGIAGRLSDATNQMVVSKAAAMARLAADIATEGARLEDALARISRMLRALGGEDADPREQDPRPLQAQLADISIGRSSGAGHLVQ